MKSLYNLNDWLDTTEHIRLGEILLESGKINLIQLGMALDIQKFQKVQIGNIFVDMKILSKEDMQKALELQQEIDEYLETKDNYEY